MVFRPLCVKMYLSYVKRDGKIMKSPLNQLIKFFGQIKLKILSHKFNKFYVLGKFKFFKGKIHRSLKNNFLKVRGQGNIENFKKFWTLGPRWLSQSQNFEVINSKIVFLS